MRVTIRQIGNSKGVIIPASFLAETGLHRNSGDSILNYLSRRSRVADVFFESAVAEKKPLASIILLPYSTRVGAYKYEIN